MSPLLSTLVADILLKWLREKVRVAPCTPGLDAPAVPDPVIPEELHFGGDDAKELEGHARKYTYLRVDREATEAAA